jgi:hypothetical protein
MTCGEIVRHLAGAERFFVTKAVEDRFTEDLDPGPSLGHADTRARPESGHRDEMARLAGLDGRALASPRRDLDGAAAKAWRFLMPMVEHEVHHRRRMEDVLVQVAGQSAGPVGGPR